MNELDRIEDKKAPANDGAWCPSCERPYTERCHWCDLPRCSCHGRCVPYVPLRFAVGLT